MTRPNSGWLDPPSSNTLVTISASPLNVASKTLSSLANWTALLQDRASIVATDGVRGILSTSAPITLPSES